MLSERRKAWLKDKMHGFFLKKLPNLVSLLDMFEKTYKKQHERLLNEHFHDTIDLWKRKASPYLLAYMMGCFAPADKRSYRRQARSS